MRASPLPATPTNPLKNRLTRDDLLEIRALSKRTDLTDDEIEQEIDRIEARANSRPEAASTTSPSPPWSGVFAIIKHKVPPGEPLP